MLLIRQILTKSFIVCAAVVTALSVILAAPVQAAPGDTYTLQTVASDMTVPVAMQFAPDGRIFVAEKFGAIKIVNTSGQITTFANIPVNGDFEQGLLGIVLDPAFATNGFIYIAYTKQDGQNNRISRITASPANPAVMLAGSEKVLLDNIPSPGNIHQIGELQIGPDGKLYASVGDGATDSQASQSLSSLSGKILRINPDGTVPEDNPFVGVAGARAEIWAYGLRNPFTSAIQPSTGKFFVNDVGNDTWEEINELKKGANYGWRTCEGACSPPRTAFTDPVYQYHHFTGTVTGRSIAGGAWYEGTAYPADFAGNYFFGDYVNGWVKRLNPATGQVQNVLENKPGIVNLKVGPDGLLYVVQLNVNTGSGSISKLAFGSTPAPPAPPAGSNQLKIYAAGSPAGGQYPTMELLVDNKIVATYPGVIGGYAARQFGEHVYNYTGTLNPNQIKINFPNDYMDGSGDRNLYIDRIVLGGQTFQAEADTTYSTGTWSPGIGCAPGNKTSEMLQCAGYFQFAGTLAPVNQVPAAAIDTPVAETHYDAGDTITFSGRGSDPEDGTLPAAKLSWNIVYHHADHSHPFLTFAGTDQGSFDIPSAGHSSADTWYRLNLTATDANGQTTTASRDIYPNVVELTYGTNVPGLQLNVDGQPTAAPHKFDAVVGFQRSIEAPLLQAASGQQYAFVDWSDGGLASHDIITPVSDTTYTANYQPTGESVPGSTVKIYATGSPAAGVYPIMALLVDGQVVQTYQDVRGSYGGRQFIEYTYESTAEIAPGSIRVAFTNDAVINGEDRNLFVDRISLNGHVYETEADSTHSTGSWTPGSGCAAGNKKSEILQCGGYFQYGPATTPPAGGTSKITVYAAGSPAQGVYPTMAINVGGQVLATTTDIRGNYGVGVFIRYEYDVPKRLTNETVQVHFTNDLYAGGEDRNLYVDKVDIDGTVYQAEAPGVFSVGSWAPSTGCAPGNKSQEFLSCNGYFQIR